MIPTAVSTMLIEEGMLTTLPLMKAVVEGLVVGVAVEVAMVLVPPDIWQRAEQFWKSAALTRVEKSEALQITFCPEMGTLQQVVGLLVSSQRLGTESLPSQACIKKPFTSDFRHILP